MADPVIRNSFRGYTDVEDVLIIHAILVGGKGGTYIDTQIKIGRDDMAAISALLANDTAGSDECASQILKIACNNYGKSLFNVYNIWESKEEMEAALSGKDAVISKVGPEGLNMLTGFERLDYIDKFYGEISIRGKDYFWDIRAVRVKANDFIISNNFIKSFSPKIV